MFNLYTSQSLSGNQNDTRNTNQDLSILMKSKNCLEKLHTKIQAGKYINKNVNTIKCIEDTAKEIGRSIDNKIQNNFANILTEQTRVNLYDVVSDHQGKDDATKKLMQDYWSKKQQTEEEARRKTALKYKENRLPKIKSSETNDENSEAEGPRVQKKSVMSSLNVKLYEKQKEIESQKKNKEQKILAYLYSYMVNVIDYKIQNDTTQFLLFQKLNYLRWEQIDSVFKAIETFVKKYDLKYCTLDLQKVMQLIDVHAKTNKMKQTKKSSITLSSFQITQTSVMRKIYTPHELLGCLQNNEEISANNAKKSGIRFYGNKGKIRAIVKIQSVWRGKIVFNQVKKVREMIKKMIKIQRAYRLYKNYCNTKETIREKCLQRLNWFNQKQKKFRQEYRLNELSKKIKYEVHICCDGQNQWQRISTEKMLEKMNCYLTRIFKAFKQNEAIETNIIFISGLPLPGEVMSYYKKLLQLGGSSELQNRIIFLSPHNCEALLEKIPLSRVLYYQAKLLKKVKSIIGNEYAYIVPSAPSMDYISVCHQLNLPMYSSNPQTLLWLQSNSGSKTLLEQSGIQNKLPYASNIYSLNTLINQLVTLIQKHPHVWRWILKIDNQSNSRGIAYIDVSKLLPKKMIKIMKKNHGKSNTAAQMKQFTSDLQNIVKTNFLQGEKITIVNKDVYKYQTQFLNFFFSNGGIIEAEISRYDQNPQNLCFCVEIQPDNQWKVVSSFRKISIRKRTQCCYYESQQTTPPIQIENIVKKLIQKNCFGYFVIDCIYESDEKNQQKSVQKTIQFNGLKCYLDTFSSAYFMREFLSKQSHVLYIPYISHPNIKKITMSTFFHLCRLQNISFDIQRKMGNIFMFLDGLQSGCLGIMTFNNRSKIEAFIHAAEVLDFFSTGLDSSSNGFDQSFTLLRNSINGYLNHLRKQGLSLKSNSETTKFQKQTRRESYKQKDYLC